ncbi:MAG: hypothetical protein A2Y14_05405 [Verrucomicrobia bacterium GWF2_51_19]|nr:MAG: hypothetical protein A2Y14_05405 [Verrucomicrobia bacterium GWF2_51_19]HCJ12446.1 hypothetical protein [Opitutae bacterium]
MWASGDFCGGVCIEGIAVSTGEEYLLALDLVEARGAGFVEAQQNEHDQKEGRQVEGEKCAERYIEHEDFFRMKNF